MPPYPPGPTPYGPQGWYGYPPPSWGAAPRQDPVDPVIHQPLAPWWKRLVAILVDGAVLAFGSYVILAIVVVLASHISSSSTNSTSLSPGAVVGGLFGIWLVASIPLGIYYGAMNGSRRGQTLGKMALGIAVRDARNGSPLGFWRAFGRFMITTLFAVLLFVPYLVDSLAPLWDPRRQAWHDKLAHSVVIDLRP
jgi:uncharacterized RDD family membrane protein YckC